MVNRLACVLAVAVPVALLVAALGCPGGGLTLTDCLTAVENGLPTEDVGRAEGAAWAACLERNEQIVGMVLDGRLTLAEGAERKLALNEERPGWTTALRRRHPAAADDLERVARDLVGRAAAADPPAPPEVVHRLFAELRGMTGAGNGPEPLGCR